MIIFMLSPILTEKFYSRMACIIKRKAELEWTEFELEHDYAKHPSLEAIEQKKPDEFLRERKDILLRYFLFYFLEMLFYASEVESDSDSDVDLDVVKTRPPPKITYHRAKLEAQFKETEKLILNKVFGLFDCDYPAALDSKFNEEYKPVKARIQAGTAARKVVVLGEVVEV